MTHPEEPLTCLFCGTVEHAELLEVWDDHTFQIATCCAGLHEQIVQDVHDDPAWGTELMRRLDAGAVGGGDLRRLALTEDEAWLLDWQPRIQAIKRPAAQAFIGRWHRHNKPPPGDLFRAAAWNGPTLLGVVMVGRPVARALDQAGGIAEVTRLCIRTDKPRELTWRAASALYRHAASEAASRGYAKIITYTLRDAESGMSLRYARWKPEAQSRGGSWNRPSRARIDAAPTVPKVRWAKTLRGW